LEAVRDEIERERGIPPALRDELDHKAGNECVRRMAGEPVEALSRSTIRKKQEFSGCSNWVVEGEELGIQRSLNL
jgi:hypothetical protein